MERAPLSVPAHAEPYSVVLMREEGSGSFLVQKRSKAPGVVYPGRLGLFGGRQEAGETAIACAIREVVEEAGVELQPNELSLIARLLAHDEFGNMSFGHIYVAESLSRRQARGALSHRCAEGGVMLLRPGEIGARWRELTSVTSYAFAAYYDLVPTERRGGAVESLVSSLAKLLKPAH